MKAVLTNFNSITEPLINCFELSPIASLVDKKDPPQALVVWNDMLQDFHMMCVVANQNNILSFLVQHGKGGMRDYLDGLHAPIANVAFVWSEEDKKTAVKGGWKEDAVFIVGAPWFHYRPEKETQKGLVVFDAVHWDKEVEENYIAWDALNQIPGITPVAKLIEGHIAEKFPGKVVQTHRGMIGHLQQTFDLLKKAEVLVCMMEGTMELLAYSLDIPVIFLKEFKHTKINFATYQGEEDCLPSPACVETDLEHLAETIERLRKNPSEKEQERRAELLKWAGDPEKDRPTAKMSEIIKKLVKKHANKT